MEESRKIRLGEVMGGSVQWKERVGRSVGLMWGGGVGNDFRIG